MINSFLCRQLSPYQSYFVETCTDFGTVVTSEESCSNIEEVRAYLTDRYYPQWVVDSAIENLGLNTESWKIKISILNEKTLDQLKGEKYNKLKNLLTQEKVVGFKPVDQATIPLMSDSYNNGQSPQVFISLLGYLNNDGLIDCVEVNAKYALRPYNADPTNILMNNDSLIVRLDSIFKLIETKDIESLKTYLNHKKQTVKVQFQHSILEWVNDQGLLADKEQEAFNEWQDVLRTSKDYSIELEEPESLANDCNSIHASLVIANHCANVLYQWLARTIK